ncbi:Peptidoglycan-binding lysin domain protein [Flexistipes sinusarabici DSM 4947]|uniref:Peptidoglycan-binding lysin domain protein n=1 Tax=Flexistipes sinusarabici (strain ATCC 49648 / DSM 4947 / MAS 10) TaxID=717231 RepID=F8E8B6_FLESM|nr:LysM peptidoglycan-binding domain-containing protein [Flexistipes sinusarabici]AEI15113.1 Peptidoglycan-binding lysin domain protein [Flexistipes sinusarabici DSM 4947]
MKILKYLSLVALVVSFAFACAKAPVKMYDDTKAALNAAEQYNAKECATEEYNAAMEELKAAEEQMEEAKDHTFKGEYYDAAEKRLKAAQEKAAEAERVTKAMSKKNDRAAAELEELGKELDAIEADAQKYNVGNYDELVAKYEEAQGYIDDCEPGKANALIDEIKAGLQDAKEEIAAAKAEEMKESMAAEEETTKESSGVEKYTVVKGDTLWDISDRKYMNPFMWPLIYWANKDEIKDPDLIFPGQIFNINKDYYYSEKEEAINFAKTRGPWSLFDGK